MRRHFHRYSKKAGELLCTLMSRSELIEIFYVDFFPHHSSTNAFDVLCTLQVVSPSAMHLLQPTITEQMQ